MVQNGVRLKIPFQASLKVFHLSTSLKESIEDAILHEF